MNRIVMNTLMITASLAMMGLDFSNSRIPADEILSGGPPKDGIPALTRPVTMSAGMADLKLRPNDRVIGVTADGAARAYPIRILNWHEIVNDRLGSRDIVVSYCPLCGTGMVFDAVVDGDTLEFGVSGKLYNSDVLLYDRKTESLWSQIEMRAVTGAYSGTKLTLLASQLTTWKDWKTRHPQTAVISFQTGHFRDYDRNPYTGYERSREIMFPVGHRDARLHPKAWVIGVTAGSVSKAYPFSELNAYGKDVHDTFGGQSITISYNDKARSAVIFDSDGKVMPAITAYWFAWAAFHPDTLLFSADEMSRDEQKGSDGGARKNRRDRKLPSEPKGSGYRKGS